MKDDDEGENAPRDRAYPDEIVDLYDHIEDISWSKSNIWKVFPRWQVVEVDYRHPKNRFAVEGQECRNENKTSTTKRHLTRLRFWDSGEVGDTAYLIPFVRSSDR